MFESIRWLNQPLLEDSQAAADYLMKTARKGNGNLAVRYHTHDIDPSAKKRYIEIGEQCIQSFNEYQRLKRLPFQTNTGDEIIKCDNCGATVAKAQISYELLPVWACPKCQSDLRSPEEKNTFQMAGLRYESAVAERNAFFKEHRIVNGTRWYVVIEIETEIITYHDLDWQD